MTTTGSHPTPPDAATGAQAPAPTGRVVLPRGRRYAVRALLCGATVLAAVAIFAVWANRQVLDADNWADTSSAMLDNSEIRTQVSGYLVDEVYANVDVGGEIARALPRRLKPIAGPATSGLRDLAQRTTETALGRPRIQEAWKQANRITAQQFINIAEGNSRLVTSQGDAIVLDLRSLVVDLVARLGLPRSLADKIPPQAGHITIMSSSEVSTAKNAVSWVKGLAAVLPALAIAMLALAVYLARGRRRETLLIAGLDLIAAGLLVLVVRSIAGGYVVDQLSSTDAVRPAAEAAWSIGTRILHDVAQATVVIGIPVVAAAWVAGPYRPAVALRRAAAPSLRDRPALAYSLVAVALLLVIAWAPIPATRMPLPVLLMIVLAFAALAALRRQVAAEFPEAEPGAARAAATRAAHAVQSARRRPEPAPEPLDQLERLASLHDHGVLSDEEFAAQKTVVLANGSGAR
ncbi:MAG TPA: SHOCT domain-containing protein [Baekduia sp.]|uniref:SHOCT domain-containing protein n=1 Tax=Baekduia sp. TaxID=2600305 RepID=UPI002BD77053|nr:SHOCT domain-containing protein [Baekduia sp.]HMJ37672.1 SHOCT domain-containing protein [Baekduia sp.]